MKYLYLLLMHIIPLLQNILYTAIALYLLYHKIFQKKQVGIMQSYIDIQIKCQII